jgi:Major Facilitator Superfamily
MRFDNPGDDFTPPARPLVGALFTWLAAKTLSDISSAINMIVISLYMLSLTDDPFSIGVLLALRMLGSVIGAFSAPILSQAVSPRYAIVICDVASAVVMFFLAALPARFDAEILYLVAFMIGGLHGCYRVTIITQAPNILGYDKRHQINSILGAIDGFAVVLGGIAATVMYRLLSTKMIFLLDGLTFLLAALIFTGLRNRIRFDTASPHHDPDTTSGPKPPGIPLSSFLAVARASFLTFGIALASRFIEAFGSGTHNVGLPYVSAATYPDDPAFFFGWVMAGWGLGKTASTFGTPTLLRRLESQGRSIAPVFHICLIATFALFALIFEQFSFPVCLGLSFFTGFFDGSTETAYYSMLQGQKGLAKNRIVSISHFIERAGLGLGILLAGHSFAVLGAVATPRLFYGASIAAVVVLLMLRQARRSRPGGQNDSR